MKRTLRIIAEFVEEIDENEDADFLGAAENYMFEDWEDCDWDNVGRPIDKLQDIGWIIKNKEIIK